MAQKFKYMRSLRMTYAEQGKCFFTCRNYERLDRIEQERIRSICASCGAGDDAKRRAIFTFMTTDISFRECCLRYYISDSTLDRLRRKFYELWKVGF